MKIDIKEEDLYRYYIEEKMTSKEVANIYGCTSKCIRNYLNRFGIPVRQNAEAVALERSHWSPEKERARSEKFRMTCEKMSYEDKQRMVGPAHAASNTDAAIRKATRTKMERKTGTKSLAEDNFYKRLTYIFNESDIIRQYTDDRYPFNCDFYIVSEDLFIEYNGHQTHYTEPFNESSEEHQKTLAELSKKYDMRTWSVRDVNKINTAIKNNINLLIIYPNNKKHDYLVSDGRVSPIEK